MEGKNSVSKWSTEFLQQLSHNGSVIDQTRHALNCKQPRNKQEHLLSGNLGYLLFLELKWNTKTVFLLAVFLGERLKYLSRDC